MIDGYVRISRFGQLLCFPFFASKFGSLNGEMLAKWPGPRTEIARRETGETRDGDVSAYQFQKRKQIPSPSQYATEHFVS